MTPATVSEIQPIDRLFSTKGGRSISSGGGAILTDDGIESWAISVLPPYCRT